MPPRYMERMERQSATYRSMFGELQFDPPPYPYSRSRPASVDSTMSGLSALSQGASKPLPPPPQYEQLDNHTIPGLDKPAIPLGSLVLVTGANGWQGMHVVDQLLERGYRVRGTVRTGDKAVEIACYFGDKYTPGQFTTAVIPDMAQPGAFDIAARGCAGIMHVASVMSYSPDPHQVIAPTIAGAINALEAAAKEPTVRRFVYCSATAAAVSQGTGKRNTVTHESWNMAAFKTAWEPPPYNNDRAYAVFASSKMQTEQAVWRWVRSRRPHFAINTVLPNVLWGKILDPGQEYRTSVVDLALIFDGNARAAAWQPPQYFVDVQDSALLHVAALILPDIQGQRLFAAHSPYNIDSVLQLLRGLYPDKAIAGDVNDHGVDLTSFTETWKSEDLLKRMGRTGWTDIETSISRTCEAFQLPSKDL
ncbi:hypothetical protein LTR17_025902 [Elasticomyces elasticus]|nr:hypothetical protein LTR17_025902 [Elasticomyces elasticus]